MKRWQRMALMVVAVGFWLASLGTPARAQLYPGGIIPGYNDPAAVEQRREQFERQMEQERRGWEALQQMQQRQWEEHQRALEYYRQEQERLRQPPPQPKGVYIPPLVPRW